MFSRVSQILSLFCWNYWKVKHVLLFTELYQVQKPIRVEEWRTKLVLSTRSGQTEFNLIKAHITGTVFWRPSSLGGNCPFVSLCPSYLVSRFVFYNVSGFRKLIVDAKEVSWRLLEIILKSYYQNILNN